MDLPAPPIALVPTLEVPMKASSLIAIASLTLSAHAAPFQADCSNTQEGLTPLNDLAGGSYLGRPGGLYPGSSNTRPAAHTAAGLVEAGRVRPRDPNGHYDPIEGKVILMSVGMSNTRQEFATFMADSENIPNLNPRLVLFNGAQGGVGIDTMSNPNAPYWDGVVNQLTSAGHSPLQVQAIWLKQAYANPPTTVFPDHAQAMAGDLASIVRTIRDRFPNARLCYCTSRMYGGYSMHPLRNEPLSYESGFGFKLLIAAQIHGAEDLRYRRAAPTSTPLWNRSVPLPVDGPEAPWLSWGPYMWADGIVPRSDGLNWLCEDMSPNDGHHPAAGARAKFSAALTEFFTTDPTAVGWFLQ